MEKWNIFVPLKQQKKQQNILMLVLDYYPQKQKVGSENLIFHKEVIGLTLHYQNGYWKKNLSKPFLFLTQKVEIKSFVEEKMVFIFWGIY
jgi:hypothetical protein